MVGGQRPAGGICLWACITVGSPEKLASLKKLDSVKKLASLKKMASVKNWPRLKNWPRSKNWPSEKLASAETEPIYFGPRPIFSSTRPIFVQRRPIYFGPRPILFRAWANLLTEQVNCVPEKRGPIFLDGVHFFHLLVKHMLWSPNKLARKIGSRNWPSPMGRPVAALRVYSK